MVDVRVENENVTPAQSLWDQLKNAIRGTEADYTEIRIRCINSHEQSQEEQHAKDHAILMVRQRGR